MNTAGLQKTGTILGHFQQANISKALYKKEMNEMNVSMETTPMCCKKTK